MLSPPFLAAVSIGAFAAAESGFVGIEVAAVNASFDLVRQRYKAVQLIIGTQSVMIVDRGGLCLGDDIKPEERLFAILLLESLRRKKAVVRVR